MIKDLEDLNVIYYNRALGIGKSIGMHLASQFIKKWKQFQIFILIKHAKQPTDIPKDAKDPYSIFFLTIADKLNEMQQDEEDEKSVFL